MERVLHIPVTVFRLEAQSAANCRFPSLADKSLPENQESRIWGDPKGSGSMRALGPFGNHGAQMHPSGMSTDPYEQVCRQLHTHTHRYTHSR